MEAEILSEIRDSERKADESIERARREKEEIVRQAIVNSSKLLAEKKEEMRKLQEKKIMEFRDKARLIKEEKIAEGKTVAKQLKAKSEKNIEKAIDFIMKQFEEVI